jgi:hypothetical protein
LSGLIAWNTTELGRDSPGLFLLVAVLWKRRMEKRFDAKPRRCKDAKGGRVNGNFCSWEKVAGTLRRAVRGSEMEFEVQRSAKIMRKLILWMV